MLSLSKQKNPAVESIFWHSPAVVSSMLFCTTATNEACPLCLVHSLAETTGACNAACPRCLVPSLAKTAGACCQTQLAHNVSCPCWPRPLGLAVHKVCSPTMLKPLWRDFHLACCKKIISSPAVLWLLAVTFAGLLFDCCFDCCAAVPSTPFCMTATIDLAHLQYLAPSLAETAGACGQMFVACLRCLMPSLAKILGLLSTGLACPQCLASSLAKTAGLAARKVSSSAMLVSAPSWRNRHLACC